LSISVPVSSKLVFSNRVTFARVLREEIFGGICPVELKFTGSVVLSKNISIQRIFVEVMHWNVYWNFCIAISCGVNFAKILVLKTASY